MDEFELPSLKTRFEGLSAPTDEETLAVLLSLRTLGIMDRSIANAFEALPRRLFLNQTEADRLTPFESMAPIPCGQVQSAPVVTSKIIDALKLDKSVELLELGTGSGFQTALMAKLVSKVFTVERFSTLNKQAEERFRSFNIHNVTAMLDDGENGWPRNQKFDRIVINFAIEQVPPRILGQLKEDGALVAPIIDQEPRPMVTFIQRDGDRLDRRLLFRAPFLPVIPGIAAIL